MSPAKMLGVQTAELETTIFFIVLKAENGKRLRPVLCGLEVQMGTALKDQRRS
jgi:hypothetical protein